MDEVEKKVAGGELNVSLSEQEKKLFDEREAANEKRRLLAPGSRERSDKPPVKVKFLPEDGDRSPGWSRKSEAEAWKSILEDMEGPESRGINESFEFPVDTAVLLSPSDLPDRIKPISPQSMADIEKQLTPEGIEAELSEGVSPERFDKVQQLIDQYGTEVRTPDRSGLRNVTREGLSRLRQSDPEAARRFEREGRGAPSRDTPVRSETRNGGQPPDDSP